MFAHPLRLTAKIIYRRFFPNFLLVNLLILSFCNFVSAQIAVPIDGVEGKFLSYKNFDGKTWIGTDIGLYNLEEGTTKATLVSKDRKAQSILDFYEFDDKLWFVGEWQFFNYIEKGSLKMNESGKVDGHIIEAEEFDDKFWFTTKDKNFYYINKGEAKINPVNLYDALKNEKCNIKVVEDKLWVGTMKGLFFIERGTTKLIYFDSRKIVNINEFDERLWFISLEKYDDTWDEEKYDDTWDGKFGTAKINYIFRDINGILRTMKFQLSIYDSNLNLMRVDNYLLVKDSSGGYIKYIIKKDKNTSQYNLIPTEGINTDYSRVNYFDSVVEFAGRFLGKRDGKLFQLYQNQESLSPAQEPISGIFGVITGIKKNAGRLWIGTEEGLYSIKNEEIRANLNMRAKNVSQMRGDGKNLWFTADKDNKSNAMVKESQLFRIDIELEMKPYLSASDSWWKNVVSGISQKDILIEGNAEPSVRLIKNGNIVGNIKDFSYVIPKDGNCNRNFNDAEFRPSDAAYPISGWGAKKLCIVIRDNLGNIRPYDDLDYWVVPGFLWTTIFIPIFLWLLAGIIILLAPYNGLCHRFVMNYPKFRNISSLGLIPALLSVFPSVRNHILRRYLRNIKNEKDFNEWRERYVYPNEEFHPEKFGEKMNEARRLLLLGQSGIGKTSYFKHLMSCYTGKKSLLPKKVIPVLVKLSNYRGGAEPKQLVYDQLRAYGEITDEELNDSFLKQGNFLIFFDGINEIPNSDLRAKLSQFVEQNWKASYICLSSQQYYTEFSGLVEVKAEPLDKEKVNRVLRNRLGNKAQEVINDFNDEMYQLYQIPRDLEFAVEIKQRKGNLPLPKSRKSLYKESLKPIISEWERNQSDYPNLLYERAYEMLVNREVYFNNSNKEFPSEIRKALNHEDYRYLVTVGREENENYVFRHDLIRAYLASNHFSDKWKKLLAADNVEVNVNWLEMLKFTISDIKEPKAIYDLMSRVLEKSSNTNFVGELFKWIQTQQLNLNKDLEDQFKLKFADAKLEEINN